jgi:hypothetical protein
MALCLSLLCIIIITFVYRFTHKSSNYSQAFVQTLFLTGLVTTLIMIVIGSNIARAFSLVGALSIIRFRNAVKETRDVGYIFFCMAVAMACGTRFYLMAFISVTYISAVMAFLHVFNYGSSEKPPERMLTVQLTPGMDPESIFNDLFTRLFDSWSVVSVETVRQGMYLEAVYTVQAKPQTSAANVIDEISNANNNLKVVYNFASSTDEV